MPSVELTMVIPGISDDGDPVLTTRKIHVNTERIAYFHGTPDGDQTMLQCDGGAHVHLRHTGPEIIQKLKAVRRDELEEYQRFTMIATEKTGQIKVPVLINEKKVNLIVPNPDETASIQVGNGYVLHVEQDINQVRVALGF